MKYGLIVYDELNGAWRNGNTYLPTTVNIGDYIQSIAARQFLPQVDCFVEREQVRYYAGEPVKLVMNGWWRIFDGTALTSDAIVPLYTSYHISRPGEVTQETIEHLKKHQPIGCRDGNTLRFLLENGVEAYFSACLTLTLGKTYPQQPPQSTKVVFSDFACDGTAPADARQQRLMDIAKDVLGGAAFSAESVEHSLPLRHTSHEHRFSVADSYLRTFAGASLVITSRLHAGLPCLGMGVPTLFCFRQYDSYRYQQLIDFMHYAGFKGEEFMCNFPMDACLGGEKGRHVFVNPRRHEPYVESLSAEVQRFIDA